MRIAVVGRGLIGSAAARHLALAGAEVILIGPDEPEDRASHTGVFASHYDEGRITRQLDSHPFWAEVSRASIARYAEIEAASGLRFFTAAGALHAGPAGSDWIARIGAGADASGVPHSRMTGTEAAAAFPMLWFSPDWTVFHEAANAGYISPRRLVQAQTRAAVRAGAQVIPAEVTGIDTGGSGVTLRLAEGTVQADTVLVATGGFTPGLLPDLPLTVYARTVALLEVDAMEATRLAAMPSMVTMLENGRDPYILPPIRYPDGRRYLKIGGDPDDLVLRDAQDARAWFRSGGRPEVGAALAEHLHRRMPGLRAAAPVIAPCVTTFTAAGLPLIDRLDDRLCVAVAGCGKGAKCSDELGRLAADLALGGAPDPRLTLSALTEAA
jgi:sarcosine oxidase